MNAKLTDARNTVADFHHRIDQALPSPARCILHLQLLAALARLRDSIRQQGGLFGCSDTETNSKADLRWTIYIAKAVQRFEKWYKSVIKVLGPWSGNGLDAAVPDRSRLVWTEHTLPPLDVLMVLHSYMLNPRDFLQDCLHQDLLSVWKAGFPWDLVEANLNPETFAYEPPQRCIEKYERTSGERWDGINDDPATIRCPTCSLENTFPWAELYSGGNPQCKKGNIYMPIRVHCPACGQAITQETMSIARFRTHLQDLWVREKPLPGTFLTADGLLLDTDTKAVTELEIHPLKLNKLLQSDFGKSLLKRLADDISEQEPNITLDGVRKDIEAEIAASDSASQAALTAALSRTMARYYRNASPFALDLVGAVMRQGTFITKMEGFDWLRSPVLKHTVTRAIKRYRGFFEVMAAFPNNVVVPTFDVDLIWHTHQLCSPNYYDYSIRHCNNVFIDHDDKIGDGALGNAFKWTCEAYAKLTGEPYDKCLCWSCELLEQAAQTSASAKVLRPSSGLASRIKSRLRKREAKYEPSSVEIEVIRIQLSMFERDYAKTRDKSSVSGDDVPNKLDFFNTYVWHHPSLAPLPQELQP